MHTVTSVKELQELNPYIIIGCGGGGEKFANFEGIKAVGFVDNDKQKQGRSFCGSDVSSDLLSLLKNTDVKSVAIMLPIGAEGTALMYAVQAISAGKNVVSSFRSLSLTGNSSLLKLAKDKNVVLKEITPRLDIIEKIFGVGTEKCCEILPKISYKPKASIVFVGGTSQECGKRTTTRLLGKEAMKRGINIGIISTDEMGLEEPTDMNFRAGSLSVMDISSAILQAIKTVEEKKSPEIIFIEGQASLTEIGNSHPRGLSASILFGAAPDATIVCHRPNHPYRHPRGIDHEIKAIEAIEPTKVVGLSVNLLNVDENENFDDFSVYNLPVADMRNGGAKILLDSILDYLNSKDN
ncbi:MAG: DUF1611 domain-containing protein [Methanobrevibacter sp.]|nr:DUF1611 domain-containing protein [Candidatus Methanovirga aequatorialis]